MTSRSYVWDTQSIDVCSKCWRLAQGPPRKKAEAWNNGSRLVRGEFSSKSSPSQVDKVTHPPINNTDFAVWIPRDVILGVIPPIAPSSSRGGFGRNFGLFWDFRAGAAALIGNVCMCDPAARDLWMLRVQVLSDHSRTLAFLARCSWKLLFLPSLGERSSKSFRDSSSRPAASWWRPCSVGDGRDVGQGSSPRPSGSRHRSGSGSSTIGNRSGIGGR